MVGPEKLPNRDECTVRGDRGRALARRTVEVQPEVTIVRVEESGWEVRGHYPTVMSAP